MRSRAETQFRFIVALGLGTLGLTACAADAGDTAKGVFTPSSTTVLTATVGTTSTTQVVTTSDTVPTTTSSSSVETFSTPVTTSSASSSSSVSVGAGCATGATVIVMPANGQSGNFNTTGPVCVEIHGGVPTKWAVYNGAGRMVTAVGATTVGPEDATSASGNAIAPGPDGFVYFNFTAGSNNYTSMSDY